MEDLERISASSRISEIFKDYGITISIYMFPILG